MCRAPEGRPCLLTLSLGGSLASPQTAVGGLQGGAGSRLLLPHLPPVVRPPDRPSEPLWLLGADAQAREGPGGGGGCQVRPGGLQRRLSAALSSPCACRLPLGFGFREPVRRRWTARPVTSKPGARVPLSPREVAGGSTRRPFPRAAGAQAGGKQSARTLRPGRRLAWREAAGAGVPGLGRAGGGLGQRASVTEAPGTHVGFGGAFRGVAPPASFRGCWRGWGETGRAGGEEHTVDTCCLWPPRSHSASVGGEGWHGPSCLLYGRQGYSEEAEDGGWGCLTSGLLLGQRPAVPGSWVRGLWLVSDPERSCGHSLGGCGPPSPWGDLGQSRGPRSGRTMVAPVTGVSPAGPSGATGLEASGCPLAGVLTWGQHVDDGK